MNNIQKDIDVYEGMESLKGAHMDQVLFNKLSDIKAQGSGETVYEQLKYVNAESLVSKAASSLLTLFH